MNDKEILKKLQNLEDKIAEHFSEYEKLFNSLRNQSAEASNSAFNRLFYQKLVISPLNICFAPKLYNELVNDCDVFLPATLAEIRANLLEKQGYIIPPFEINCIQSLPEESYMLFIRNELILKDYIDPYDTNSLDIIVAKIRELLFKEADRLITREVIWNYIKILEETDETISREITNKNLSISILRKIFVNLLNEFISIKDIRFIFQKILEINIQNTDADEISEMLRPYLIHSILNDYILNNSELNVVLLSTELENDINEARIKNNHYQLETLSHLIYEGITEIEDQDFVLLVSPHIRLALYRQLEKYDPSMKVLATTELHEELDINVLATIDMVKCYEIEEINDCEELIDSEDITDILDDFYDNDNN